MTPLILPADLRTPEINFNPETGRLLVRGISIPENAERFFKPLFDWMTDFNKQFKGNVEFTLSLTYFNTPSVRHFLEIMLGLIRSHGERLTIIWEYEEDDDEILDRGKEMSDVLKFPFSYKLIVE
ncbi:MAG: DUF1987 domain-containing protein [Bacteroidia bacterium]